ncbi:hypothetical protein EJ08DRAFT_60801 [Tothia fuscella]|uniref:Uncharacterized protein n=1 Tax=Tothia fuscella TaxID=1048955 RepID=A0A9P4NYV3_9PEZI|nr:hypothetical protein EJ08DRAFT_60801 [Tothia fuscella]
MQFIILTITALSAVVAAVPGYGSTTTTKGSPHYTTSTSCAPSTYYSTSTGETYKAGIVYSTEKSPFTVTSTKYKTIDTYYPSTYTTTSYKEDKTKVPVVYTETKTKVYTTYETDVKTSYKDVKTSVAYPVPVTTKVKSSTVIADQYLSTGVSYVTKTYTTSSKEHFTNTIPYTTSVCKAYTKTEGW